MTMNRSLAAALLICSLAAGGARAQGGMPNLYIELEPLAVTVPRKKIPPNLLIDGRINAVLLDLLQNRAGARPSEADLQGPSVRLLNSLASPAGYLLKVRYTELGFLLTEGLAGTPDLVLRDKIVGAARSGANPQVRASALMAISYSREPGDRGLFQEALLSRDITARFGAVEALLNWYRPEAVADIANAARLDASGPLRMYAAQAMARLGDPGGLDILRRGLDDADWLARAMAARYLGELGAAGDYDKLLFNLSREQNSFVKAEMCGALLRLTPLKKKASE